MSLSIERIRSQSELPCSLGFTSFLKGFGISIHNVIGADMSADRERQKDREAGTIPSPTSVTIDNAHAFFRFPNIYGSEGKHHAQREPSSLLQSSLKSMLRNQFVSLEEEIQNAKSRNKTVVWLSETYHRARLSSEVFHSTVSLMDRFLSLKSIQESQYQKLALTCLWMSAKFQDTKKYSLHSFTTLSLQQITQPDILQLQQEILALCNYNLCLPTGISFLKILGEFISIQKRTYSLAFYLLQLSMLQCRYLNYKKSLISVSCLYLATKINPTENPLEIEKLMKLVGGSLERVKEVARLLLRGLLNSKEPQYRSINKKFGTEYFFEVSQICLENPETKQ